MNSHDTLSPSATPRRRSLPMQAMALATMTTFLTMAVGCDSRTPDVATDRGEIVIRAAVLQDGVHNEVLAESLPFADVPAWDRQIIVDGVATTDLATLHGAGVVEVPLTTGNTLTLRAVGDGDVFEISGYTPREGEPTLTALRLADSSFEFYVNGADWRTKPADLRIAVEGSADQRTITAERMAMMSLLASVGDAPQLTWIALIGILGGAWLAICGTALGACAYSCSNCKGYKFQCFGFTIDYKDGDWSANVGGLAGCECIDPCTES